MNLLPVGNTRSLVIAGMLLIIGMAVMPAHAINIIPHYENVDPPANDPNGARLTAIMQAAATIWENIIRDQHTLEIYFGWQEITNGVAITFDWIVVADRVTHTRMRFNPKITFFIDPTPFDNSEFSLKSSLFSGLAATEQINFFDGTPPGVFEVGFIGTATVPAAQGSRDLLTVALHEIGHALGVCGCTNPAEQADLDYDVDPAGAFGNIAPMAVKLQLMSGEHLNDTFALMFTTPSGGQSGGKRALPSATDVAAMTATSRWVGIDLTRKYFLSGSDWHSNPNWIGSRVPDLQDDVSIFQYNLGAGRINVMLGGLADAGNLTLGIGAELDSNGFGLFVGNQTRVWGASALLDLSNGSLSTNSLVIESDAEVLTHGGAFANTVAVNNGKLRGSDTVRIGNSFELRDKIEVEGGTLTLRSTPISPLTSPPFKLIQGQIDARNGSLVIDGALIDPFGGVIHVGEGQSVTFKHGWQLDRLGTLNLRGTTSPASLIIPNLLMGQQSEFRGNINVEGMGIIDSVMRFHPSATVTLGNSADILVLDGPTIYEGGFEAGAGTLQQKGDATVTDETEITVDIYDWDGEETSPSDTVINPDAMFTINSDQVEQGDPSVDGHNGLIAVNGGTLSVNTQQPWRLDGSMSLGDGALVQGSTMVVNGSLSVHGGARISAPVDFQPTSSLALFGMNNTELVLAGPTTYRGGSYWGGFATLTQTGNAEVDADTTINVSAYDWDGHPTFSEMTIHPGKSFTINADRIERGDPATDGHDGLITNNGGRLNVNTPAPWRLDGILALAHGGAVEGAAIAVHGSIESYGADTISAALDLQPLGRIIVDSGARLQLAGPITYRGGQVRASGVLEQRANARVMADTLISGGIYDWDGRGVFPLNSTTINPGATLTLDVDKIENVPDPENDGVGGTINLNGGILDVDTPGPWRLDGMLNLNTTAGMHPRIEGMELNNRGLVNVTGLASIEAPYRIGFASSTVLPNVNDSLFLNNGVIYDGGDVVGDGKLVQNGSAVATDSTRINARVFDWDGNEAVPWATTVNMHAPLARLEINSDRIDEGPSHTDGFDGEINLVRGRLIVNTPNAWRLDGTLNFTPSGPMLPTLEGADVIVHGNIDIIGEAVLETDVDFRPTAAVNVDAGEIIHFNHPVIYRGGSFTGQGTLEHNGDITVEAPTVIEVGVFDLDGTHESNSIKINPGGGLVLKINSIDTRDNVFEGGMVLAGELTVNTPLAWTIDGQLKLLSSGRIMGASLSNKGSIIGVGEIGVDLDNFGAINPGGFSAGTLTIDGNYRSHPGATLGIELGGTAAQNHDLLQISGTATLGGTLNVGLIGGFNPTPGDSFDVLVASNINGRFDTVVFPQGVSLRVIYNSQFVKVQAF